MSRIHDTLRKLEGGKPDGSPESETGLPEGSASEPSLASESGSGVDANWTHPESERDQLTKSNALLRDFAERCPKTAWAPDPSAILYYAEEFRTPGSEEFRTLRSRLELVREGQRLQTLLITSPMPGEGKTFVAANLAQVMVWHRERHVLLIDGDLRASKLHHSL